MGILAVLLLTLTCQNILGGFVHADSGLNGQEGIVWPMLSRNSQVPVSTDPMAQHAVLPNVGDLRRMMPPTIPDLMSNLNALASKTLKLPRNLKPPTIFFLAPKFASTIDPESLQTIPAPFNRMMPAFQQEQKGFVYINDRAQHRPVFTRLNQGTFPVLFELTPENTSSRFLTFNSAPVAQTVSSTFTEDPRLKEGSGRLVISGKTIKFPSLCNT